MKSNSKVLDYPVDKRIYGNEFNKTIDYHTLRFNGRPDWLLMYTLSGAGCIRIQGMEKNTGPGTLWLYEPGSYQDYGTAMKPGHWHFLWVHFQAPSRLLPLMDWPIWSKGIRFLQVQAGGRRRELEDAMRRMIRFSGHSGEISDPLAFLALEEVFLLARPDMLQGSGTDLRVQRAIDHLRLHYKDSFGLGGLARLAGLSVSRFSHLFQLQTGKSPRQFQEEVRMEHAASLLRLSQLPVGEVAAECGYEDALYFSKRFRGCYGKSPREYRAG
jgi:AraC family transcriptional regulator of arabinose operon